jgi:hypothetical protein
MFTHGTQCMWDVLDPPVSEFSLSLYRHPFLYTLLTSRFTLIINNKSTSHPTCDKRCRVYTTVYGTLMDTVRFQNSSLSGIYLNHPGSQMESDQFRFLRTSYSVFHTTVSVHSFSSLHPSSNQDLRFSSFSRGSIFTTVTWVTEK